MTTDPKDSLSPKFRRRRHRRCLSESLLEEMETREQAEWDFEPEDFDEIVRQIQTGKLGIADLDNP